VPPTNSPQCSYLPTLQGQIAISQSKKAKEKGLKNEFLGEEEQEIFTLNYF